MDLTSYNRCLRYCGGDTVMINNSTNRRALMSWIPSVSDTVENWLNRKLQIQIAYVEYFDVRYHTFEFYPTYYPVTNIESAWTDSTGMWIGGQSQLSSISYHPSVNGAAITINFARPFEAKNGFMATYDGGMANSAVLSIYNVTFNGSWSVGKFCFGLTSNAVGIVNAVGASTLTIEVLYGRFLVGETLQQWDTEDSAGGSNQTAVYNTASSLALAESYPEIVRGVELQLRFMWKNKDRFEQEAIHKDGTSLRRRTRGSLPANELEAEVTMMIAHHRRMSF